MMNIVGAVYFYWVYCIANIEALFNSMPKGYVPVQIVIAQNVFRILVM